MLQVKLPVVDTLHLQSTNCNKFATGVGNNDTSNSKLKDSAGEKQREEGTTRAFFHDYYKHNSAPVQYKVVSKSVHLLG